METALGTDREAALADMRYNYIERLAAVAVHKPKETREQARSVRIDAVLTNKYLAIPIFLLIMKVFNMTIHISQLETRIKELVQQMALEERKHEEEQ